MAQVSSQDAPRVKVELYLQAGSDYSVRTPDGLEISLDTARQLWMAGLVSDWNLAFQRLVNENWNLAAVKHYYQEQLVWH